MGGERGQASSDYVAIALAVAVTGLGAAAVVPSHGRDIAGAVQRQLARALCVATSGDCEADRAPCVVSHQRTTTASALTLAILQLGHDRALLREQRSDGSVAVTLLDRARPGASVAFGARGRLAIAGRALALGGEIGAAAIAQLGTGRTWIVADARAADALVERVRALRPSALRQGRGPRGPLRSRDIDLELLPPADQSFDERGMAVVGRATLPGASGSIEAEDTFGTRTDRRSGQVTAYVRRRNALAGTLGAAVRDGERSEQYAVTFDRDGRPLDLVVLTTGASVSGQRVGARSPATGPGAAPPGSTGSAGAGRGAGRAWTTETHLDLTDAENLAAAGAFLARVRDPEPRLGDVARVSAALRRRLDAAGVVHVRELALERDGYAVGARVALGIQVGFELERSTQTARVVSAATRGIDGVWRARDDCVAAA